MAELPVSESVSGMLRVGTSGGPADARAPTVDPRMDMSRAPIGTSSAGAIGQSAAAKARALASSGDGAWPRIVGFFVFILTGVLAGMSASSWALVMAWAGEPWTSEACRWSVVAFLGITALSCLNTRPVFVVIAAALFAVTGYTTNLLLAEKAVKWSNSMFGDGHALAALAGASAVFGYLVHATSRPRAPSARGILSLLIVALACLGTVRGWFTWSDAAKRISPGAVSIVSEWGQEVTWATVLVLTAVGVSWSRTRPVHLLNAVMLVALAYACIRGGYSREVQFPELSQGGTLIKIDHDTYTNVDVWRWVIAVELVCLSAVLIHLSAGLGALTTLFAVVWMCVGLGMYQSVGTMALVHGGYNALGGAMAPLNGMGLPIGPMVSPTRPTSTQVNNATASSGIASSMENATANMELNRLNADAMRASKKARLTEQELMAQLLRDSGPSLIGDLAVYGWMLLTSVFAGVLAVCGLRMVSEHVGYRYFCFGLVWAGLLAGGVALAMAWPKESGQAWEKWLAAFRYGRHHEYVFWLVFVGTMGFAGIWALVTSPRAASWTNLAVAAILLGTATSLVAAAILIRFGGFPPLPVWVYAIVAAGQSSLAWVLLFRVNPVSVQRRETVA
ncbi:MAG: hypothetical protein AABZ08_06035 [Planctomycetota bacterium]